MSKKIFIIISFAVLIVILLVGAVFSIWKKQKMTLKPQADKEVIRIFPGTSVKPTPKTNPFDVKTNPFNVKTNPFE